MTHQEIEEKEIIERYVLHQLAPEERLAFQEHYFSCDECFERAQVEARFIASVRKASDSGVLAPDHSGRPPFRAPSLFGTLTQRWGAWVMPALAATLLLTIAIAGLWVLSLRRENQQLATLKSEQSRAAEQLQILDAKIQELEAGDTALQEETKALREENTRLKEQLDTGQRANEDQLAKLNQVEVNVPIRNIYPTGDPNRSGQTGEINRVSVPRGTRAFLLILGDYKPGYANYRLEILDPSGRLVASRKGLKPDQAGDLSVMLNRTLMSQSKYRLKLYGRQQLIAEYDVRIQ